MDGFKICPFFTFGATTWSLTKKGPKKSSQNLSRSEKIVKWADLTKVVSFQPEKVWKNRRKRLS